MRTHLAGLSVRSDTSLKSSKSLKTKAVDCSSLSSAFSSIIPPGWDSPAFCSNLKHASSEGMKVASNFKPALARVIYEWSQRTPEEAPLALEGGSLGLLGPSGGAKTSWKMSSAVAPYFLEHFLGSKFLLLVPLPGPGGPTRGVSDKIVSAEGDF